MIFTVNGVLPVFLVLVVGCLLKKYGMVSNEFVRVSDKLVFKLLLPAYLFCKVSVIKKDEFLPEDLRTAAFAMIITIVLTVIIYVISGIFIKDLSKKGAFVQGAFRSNTAILGVPFAESLFGADGARVAVLLLACVVPIYNILAVIILSATNGDKNEKDIIKTKFSKRFSDFIKGIFTNNLIIAILLGLIVCFTEIKIGTALTRTINYIADGSTPLALLSIGAGFSLVDGKGRTSLAFCSAVIKTVIMPFTTVVLAILFGFSGAHLGAVFIIFGTPAAVSSYIMAKNMGNDYKLSSRIIIITTLMSVFTIAIGSFLLFTTNLAVR